MTEIKLTITMLVSNRIGTIRKCMDSINPLLRKIPSELIVVDTESTDGSIDIVREYTDRIISFAWCNDFARARNAGLEKARGEWEGAVWADSHAHRMTKRFPETEFRGGCS